MRKSPALAKLSPPQPPAVFPHPRTRLFRRLRRAGAPVVWVTGPPGAGKTTLVASYLAARKLRSLWYQLDAGDGDLATFFYYLRLAAAKAVPRVRRPLPLLTPEYLKGLPAFTRRVFQDFYGRLVPPFLLVFDNYQELPAEAALHAVLRDALAELPPGGRALVISRAEPPPAFARLRASQAMEMLDWEALQLTPDETRRIARRQLRQRLPAETVRTLHETTGGWVAGLVLLLERLEAQGLPAPSVPEAAREGTFDYFAAEVLSRADRETREVLLQTALLPKMTARMAEALTGSPRAGRLLAELARRYYFTTRHAQPEPAYEYHPLFRQFLRTQAEGTFRPARLTELQRAAAALLEAADQVEAAAGLFQEIRDWAGLERLILTRAPALLAQGRWQTLEEWLGSLPPERLERDPWLLYWLGACRSPANLRQGLAHFERAFDGFRIRADRAGTFLAWSGAVDAINFEWSDFTRLDRWIAALEELLCESPEYPSAEVEARVTASMFTALMYRQPDHPEMARWLERAERVARTSPDATLRATTSGTLAAYWVWAGEPSKAGTVIASLREAVCAAQASPLVQLRGMAAEAQYFWITGSMEQARQVVAAGLALAQSTGVHAGDHLLLAAGVYAALSTGDLAAGRKLLQEMAPVLEDHRILDIALHHYLAAWEAMLAQDQPRALAHTERALELAIEAGTPNPVALCRLGMAQVVRELGDRHAAAEHLSRAREIGEPMKSHLLLYLCLLEEASAAVDQGKEAAGLAALREAMALGRQQGFVNFGWWRSSVMARLCARALEAGIEVEYVRELIRRRGLEPPAEAVGLDAWPWPVRVYALGRFEVQVDDRPVTFAGRAQKKPLALLKVLVAFGGRGVPERPLAEALWPEAEGDAAHQALAVTLHRLRRLLGHEAAIGRQEGRLTLDPRRVWVDLCALDAALEQAGRGAPEARAGLTDAVLRLYRGPLLTGDEDEAWSLVPRERLRVRVLRHLGEAARAWEAAGDIERVIGCYLRALELDDCAEALYRRLIDLYQRLGRRAEALALYERCRARLAAVLGVEPAPETRALVRALRAGAA